jgi:hypothetical protein
MTGGAPEIRAPEHLTIAHDVSGFDSGVPDLDEWLRKRALANEDTGASRTYVVCAGGRVVGYYALASGGVAHGQAPGRVRRKMPDPVPVMILGRLAVDRDLGAVCCATRSGGYGRPPRSVGYGPCRSTRSPRRPSGSISGTGSARRRSIR